LSHDKSPLFNKSRGDVNFAMPLAVKSMSLARISELAYGSGLLSSSARCQATDTDLFADLVHVNFKKTLPDEIWANRKKISN